MRRSPLNPGKPLKRRTPLERKPSTLKRRPVSPASAGQKFTGAERTCEECGKDFYAAKDCSTRASRFCSKECGWARQKREAEKTMPSAAELRRLHHDEVMSVADLRRHYARSEWWVRNALATRGVEFRTSRAPVFVVCEQCGKRFQTSPSQAKRGRRFCSHACKGKGLPAPSKGLEARRKIAASKMGPKNAQWRGEDTAGSVYRVFSIRHKPELICRNCNTEAARHLHHIVPRSMCKAGVRDLRNGLPLCMACHLGWHRRRLTIYRDVFTAEEWAFVSSLQLLGQNVGAWLDDRYPARPLEAAA